VQFFKLMEESVELFTPLLIPEVLQDRLNRLVALLIPRDRQVGLNPTLVSPGAIRI
jgi:hypothetical protein